MKKRTIGLICLLGILSGILCGCSKSVKKELPEGFDRETVLELAETSIEYFNAGDYQNIIEMGSAQMQESITAEQFAEASDPYLEKCGEFEEIEKTVEMGTEEDKKVYGGVVMVGKYEKGKIQFTIMFDENMEMVQFTIK